MSIHHYDTGIHAKGSACHVMIRDVARGIAAAAYEMCASRDDDFYKKWPYEKEYVNQSWTLFIEQARQTLTDMLTRESTPQEQKDAIYEALTLDNTVRQGRRTKLQSMLN